MSALADEPAIHDVVAQAVTDRLVDRFVTGGTAGTDTPASLFSTEGLTRLASIQLIDRTVQQVVGSSAFHGFWESANRIAHSRVVALLRGERVAGINVRDGQVVVDLAPLVSEVQARLRDAGFPELLPAEVSNVELVLFESTELTTAQRAVDLLITLRWVLAVVTVVSLVGFIWLSRGKSRAIVAAGLALALGMVLVLAALALVRAWYAGDRTLTLDDAAATAVFDVVTGYLRTSARGVAIGGLLVAGAAWVLMPGNAWRTGIDGYVTRHRHVLYAAVIALATISVVLQNQPSVSSLATILVIASTALAFVWRLGRLDPLPQPHT